MTGATVRARRSALAAVAAVLAVAAPGALALGAVPLGSVAAAQTASGTTVRIDAGGSGQTVGGVTWRACTSPTACDGATIRDGGWSSNQSPPQPQAGVVAPANEALYRSQYYAGPVEGKVAGQRAFGFDVPVANGSYRVRLHFSEVCNTAAGQRLFDVNLEAARVLDDYESTPGPGEPTGRSSRSTPSP